MKTARGSFKGTEETDSNPCDSRAFESSHRCRLEIETSQK
jgi:hypothetical protein